MNQVLRFAAGVRHCAVAPGVNPPDDQFIDGALRESLA
jgi:hypothetical protein